MSLKKFTDAYFEAALWASTDMDGEPLDRQYGLEDFAPETKKRLREIAKDFYEQNEDLIYDDPTRAGHDLWLTQNHHGAGFWDGDWEEDGEELTANAHAQGSVDLYVGDDDRIYVYG